MWFAEHRVAIKGLPDVRQQEYEDIRALPQPVFLALLKAGGKITRFIKGESG